MPKEYIERGALIEKSTYMFDEALGRCKCVLVEDVDKIPTTDVVEVVRCKDCKYTDVHICPITGKETLFCEFGRRGIKPEAVNPTHFCSYGERKDK